MVWDRLGGRALVEKSATSAAERAALGIEARLLSRGHPAFPALFDVAGPSDEPRALALEWVFGAPLSPTTASLGAIVDLLAGLAYLHEQGFVHGDLKPAHLLVDGAGRGRLLDLGLASPIGGTAKGGTLGYLPPERMRGAAASVAGDLFSFGVALRATLLSFEPSLGALLEACCDPDPAARPLSALACINALGGARRQLDIDGSFARLGSRAPLDRALETISRSRGEALVVVAPPGTGRRRFLRDLARAARDRRAEAIAKGEGGGLVVLSDAEEMLSRWAEPLGVSLPSSREAALDALACTAAAQGVALVLAADEAILDREPDAAIVRGAFARAGGGAFLHLTHHAPSPAVGDVVALPIASDEDARALWSAAGARLDASLWEVVLTRTSRRLGLLARLARHAAAAPLTSPAAVEQALLAITSPGQDREPPRAPTLRAASRAVARAHAIRGEYARARELLTGIAEPSVTDRLLLVECLERSGVYSEARSAAEGLLDDAEVGVPALTLAAHVTLALGQPEAADALAERGLARAPRFLADHPVPPEEALGLARHPHEIVGRLWAIRSDAALRRARVEEAVAFADRALALATSQADDALAAQAQARLGAARGLSGDPARARDHYRAALQHAERAGDVGRLPAFIMNLATSEHALGEVGPALEHYQESAALAERLGRRANLLAALVNLAGLWSWVGARVEAQTMLARAEPLADELGDAVYRAQSTLLRAELARDVDLPAALELAREAHQRFVSAGATRLALEANLLTAELSLRAGAVERALGFVERASEELTAAGLGARAHLLTARAELARDRADAALAHGERALSAAAGDRELAALARFEIARTQHARAPGSGTESAALAREEIRALQSSLPPALRERFLRTPERQAVERGLEQVGPVASRRVLSVEATRLLGLVRRLLGEGEERRVLELAVDEAVQLTGAERALLVLARPRGAHEIVVARNVARTELKSATFRFSRSVVDRVIRSGESILTASALEDPSLDQSRSILDLGLRSILALPIRGPHAVLGALYLDHRLEHGRFGEPERELGVALADIVGMALEKTRLVERAEARAAAAAREAEAAYRESLDKGRELERLAELLRRAKAAPDQQGGIIGSSHKMLAALDVARRVAKSDLPVLVRGESGTGKELFARFVHAESARKAGPFVAINCGAVPESLLESELFGHKRGAFTGAVTDSPGLFRLADGGTLFLDEIGEMPLRMQTRLLRVLQEGEVRSVGGSETVKVDVRIVAATHRNLEEATASGTFREDLYYRLLGARVALPPLRERREDILDLARAVLAKLSARHQRSFELSREAETALLRHDWPGNVRELEQALTRGALLAEGAVIKPANLDLRAAPSAPRRAELQALDRTLIEQALRAAKGNRTLAARALGVSRVTLHRWMKRYEIS